MAKSKHDQIAEDLVRDGNRGCKEGGEKESKEEEISKMIRLENSIT